MRQFLPILWLIACDTPTDLDGVDSELVAGSFTKVIRLPSTGYIVEGVTYLSDGLTIVGQVCRPATPGRYPILLFNHGGFSGLGAEWNGALCAAAANGFVIAMSSYRGEDDSGGHVEICNGEVDDTIAMLAAVRAQPYADGSRAVMFGASHGGCITLRALARGIQVRAAADLFGPVHWEAMYADMVARLADPNTPPALAATYVDIRDRLLAATGGTPDQVPAAYRERSPLFELAALNAAAPDLMVVHGTADPIVIVAHSCALASGLVGEVSHHVDVHGAVTTSSPTGCSGPIWSPTPLPAPSWPGHRHLVIHDGAGHGTDAPLEQPMATEALQLLLARIQ